MGYPVRLFRLSSLLFLFTVFVAGAGVSAQKDVRSHALAVELEHEDPQWPLIQVHLPDPATASGEKLEIAADVLRARRFPEDALDYYADALKRGADEVEILNKMGVTELEVGNHEIARAFFQRVVHVKRKNPDGWNNLGAVEYLEGQNGSAISDYKKAIKLDKKSAPFHSNLGTAYFQTKDFERARKEFDVALKIDPDLMVHRGGPGGITMRMLSPADHARFCYELARLYAQHGDVANMLHYLTTASEGGFDVLEAMRHDDLLEQYRKDPRVLLLVHNAEAIRSGHMPLTASTTGLLPPLPSVAH
ncbi:MULTISPECIES: tetratricopeptide repeat protein [Acidobacteriaceae]|uniref:tetratricopeptide repeat protein n=1 Tax=Acidobacteriaceae TaxID=204434 RepID=UPI00131CFA15|nr:MULTISPECIES: tetratricopeptide repeat protein [Acidobacteriaceae]MDW5267288.1 tetratricopeptide repeat protein [Edaphobacter sp.]